VSTPYVLMLSRNIRGGLGDRTMVGATS